MRLAMKDLPEKCYKCIETVSYDLGNKVWTCRAQICKKEVVEMFPRNWFSNFIPFDIPMCSGGLLFETPEHYYQAAKTPLMFQKEMIAAAKTPGQAKRLGSKVQLHSNWDSLKLSVMETVLRYKFTKDTTHGKKLIHNPEALLELNNWHDNYWGLCVCPKCNHIEGQNHLGKLLITIRNDLL
jgi:ribA/ribD-fused uncharacterized protein